MQTLKGHVKEYMSNLNNLVKPAAEAEKKPQIIKKPSYVPVKEKIHFHEKDTKPDNEEFLLKHKSIAKKLIDDEDGPIIEKAAIVDNNHEHENGTTNGNHHDAPLKENPPKPLPRKSLSEQGSIELDSNVFPRPKPRTAATGYKVQELCNFHFYSRFVGHSF